MSSTEYKQKIIRPPRSQRTNVHSLRKCVLSVLFSAASVFTAGHAAAAPVGANTDLIAGRQVESLTIRNPDSKVCIVFENGLRGTLDSWGKVIDLLGPDASIFAYNRPGYGHSQEAATLRDGSTIVEELRQALQQKGLRPPYVLVGHSLGGLYMQLFAKRYPEEVSGLVLVDSAYPGVIKKPEDFPLLTRGAKRLFFSSSVNNEIDLMHKTGEQVLALAPINDKPIVQLFNRPTDPTAIPVSFGVDNSDPRTIALVRGLYPNATKIILDSDHQMQKQSPAEVAEAIKNVIARRSSSR